MKINEAKKVLKEKLPDYLASKGLPNDGRHSFRCLNPCHEDKHPSMSFYRAGNMVRCFACGAKYDIFDLIGIDHGVHGFMSQLRYAADMYCIDLDEPSGSPPFLRNGNVSVKKSVSATSMAVCKPAVAPVVKDYTDYINRCAANNEPALEYLSKRGIDRDVAARFCVGYDPHYYDAVSRTVWPAIVIPNGMNVIVRNIAGNMYRKLGASVLWNLSAIDDAIKNGDVLIVVEGEIDAMSVITACRNALALGSVNNYRQLVPALLSAAGGDISKVPLVVLALDNDAAGKNYRNKLAKELENIKCQYKIVNLYGDYKDANDALVHDKESLVKNINDLVV